MKWLLLTFFTPLFWSTQPHSEHIAGNTQFKDSLPPCLKEILLKGNKDIPPSIPLSIIEYQYNGKKVYYLKAECCDQMNKVYDDSCHYLGAPDGGFTGRGDGKLNGFFSRAKKIRLIEKW